MRKNQQKKSKIIIFKGFWNVEDVEINPKALFLYGDNNVKIGKGGQAIIRDLPNTFGIPTKKYPSNHSSSFYTDKEFQQNAENITNAINSIIMLSNKYDYVVLPENGFGTGLSELPQRAPKTYKYLSDQIKNLINII
ncbi:hypothetical protein QLL95_gp1018 [Cotonvirus japonicus]|uniref:DUF7831 domain-containing protein n=1 Tax=Cotonvirus japonicus TaxID=2811091 RepID=A0ABM7NSG1_9VIRU|nr:hypothetical protein QLL95_gp1018 [Cotonvirus japonicus]BCS83105.1 hypothetical protein [Cotonvirus japonicus]